MTRFAFAARAACLLLTLLLTGFVLAACDSSTPKRAATSPGAAGSTTTRSTTTGSTATRSSPASPSATASATGTVRPAETVGPTRTASPAPSVTVVSSVVALPWRWPNSVQPAYGKQHSYPVPPLPTLVKVAVGAHENEQPAYDRISFTFTTAFPSYDILWVTSLVADGSGKTVPLAGDGIVRIRFRQAQAHDDSGSSTVLWAPSPHPGYLAVHSYAMAGDFEGVITVGVGSFRTVHESNGELPVRAIEVKQTDGHGGYRYVVAIDIQTRGLGGTM